VYLSVHQLRYDFLKENSLFPHFYIKQQLNISVIILSKKKQQSIISTQNRYNVFTQHREESIPITFMLLMFYEIESTSELIFYQLIVSMLLDFNESFIHFPCSTYANLVRGVFVIEYLCSKSEICSELRQRKALTTIKSDPSSVTMFQIVIRKYKFHTPSRNKWVCSFFIMHFERSRTLPKIVL
jgi:hypothetical protein